MKVLIACEESQTVCKAFRDRGHEAFSCDIQEPSGGHLEWHILGDVLQILTPILGGIDFETMDGEKHSFAGGWDLIIAHPPCTYLSNVATRWHSLRCTDLERINERTDKRVEAIRFFMCFVNARCDRVAIENPRGVMSTVYRKPDQIIGPYMFADSELDAENYIKKATCLWLKGLKPLTPKQTNAPDLRKMCGVYPSGKVKCWVGCCVHSAKDHSKTFRGIARAMAEQWG